MSNDYKKIIEDTVIGEERAFYGLSDTSFVRCRIEGEEDGESAFKECRSIELCDCVMSLRYPLWHVTEACVERSVFGSTCRAPMWYCDGLTLRCVTVAGVKAVRE